MGPPRVAVTAEELRHRFEIGNYVRHALDQKYPCCLRKQVRCIAESEPPGTLSLTLGYLNHQGRRVFLVHFYLRPNGDLGASGLLDPKVLVADDGIEYFVA